MKNKKITFTVLFVILFYSIGFSQGRIFQIDGKNDFAAAVKTEQFVYYKAAVKTQEQSNWCWAACIQMVLKYQGLYVEQCDIVKKAFKMSSCIDKPADCYTIEDGVDGWSINGQQISGEVDFSASSYELIDQLAYINPVIIGLNMPGQNIGHAYVLTAVFFKYDSNNRKIPYKVVLRDPWPDNQSRQEFGWNDFVNRINCITYVNL
ncbi:C39 family peptidase [Algibacter lectus]|uniref:C39 family peptidase n=1 Tax=Algibacter lectus TaxID=221126 RepID=UPI0026ED195D|nr:papain-like cysteine protease family protein [Algibacter lectus]MDO7138142.1 papain-like cysteine protease family protein [Algibacter lectus]